ncbi:MAG: hypothetical protein HDQ89_10505 [Desulfovibrio sp.]|nr:hypothetical protein [Desulfovibrio sp.]
MSKLGFFLGGALAGAAGLAAAALLDRNSSAPELPGPSCGDSPAGLDAAAVASALNEYFFKAHELARRCSTLSMESCELSMGPIDLPDDSLLQKAANAIGSGLTRVVRGFRNEDLRSLHRQAATLFSEYRPIFQRGNELLKGASMAGVGVSTKELNIRERLDNRLDNEDWFDDLDEGCSRLNTFLTDSADAAQELIEQLETLQKYGGPAPLSLAGA